jgi:hypothetical protein
MFVHAPTVHTEAAGGRKRHVITIGRNNEVVDDGRVASLVKYHPNETWFRAIARACAAHDVRVGVVAVVSGNYNVATGFRLEGWRVRLCLKRTSSLRLAMRLHDVFGDMFSVRHIGVTLHGRNYGELTAAPGPRPDLLMFDPGYAILRDAGEELAAFVCALADSAAPNACMFLRLTSTDTFFNRLVERLLADCFEIFHDVEGECMTSLVASVTTPDMMYLDTWVVATGAKPDALRALRADIEALGGVAGLEALGGGALPAPGDMPLPLGWVVVTALWRGRFDECTDADMQMPDGRPEDIAAAIDGKIARMKQVKPNP